jgi:chaperonin GroES
MSVDTLEKALIEMIIPLQDRIVVERALEEEKSKGGIVIPDTAKEKPIRGKVRAVGPGKRLDSGQIQPVAVKVDDEILFGKYAGTEVKLDEKEYIVMREDDVMAILKH